jgi:hypothetical protein
MNPTPLKLTATELSDIKRSVMWKGLAIFCPAGTVINALPVALILWLAGCDIATRGIPVATIALAGLTGLVIGFITVMYGIDKAMAGLDLRNKE